MRYNFQFDDIYKKPTNQIAPRSPLMAAMNKAGPVIQQDTMNDDPVTAVESAMSSITSSSANNTNTITSQPITSPAPPLPSPPIDTGPLFQQDQPRIVEQQVREAIQTPVVQNLGVSEGGAIAAEEIFRQTQQPIVSTADLTGTGAVEAQETFVAPTTTTTNISQNNMSGDPIGIPDSPMPGDYAVDNLALGERNMEVQDTYTPLSINSDINRDDDYEDNREEDREDDEQEENNENQTTTRERLPIDLQSILKGYDVPALRQEYGDIFQEYDTTRERFVTDRADIQRGLIDAQLGETGFLQQAMQRQQAGLDIQQNLLQQQVLDEGSLQSRRLDRLALQEEDIAQQQENVIGGARSQLFDAMQTARQETGGFSGSGARSTAVQRAIEGYSGDVGSRIASLNRNFQRVDLQRQDVELGSQRRLDVLGSQLDRLGLQREELDDSFQQRESRLEAQRSTLDLGQEENIFGLRERFADQTRGRLLDLIRSEADLSRFKLGSSPPPGGSNPGSTGGNDTTADSNQRTTTFRVQ